MFQYILWVSRESQIPPKAKFNINKIKPVQHKMYVHELFIYTASYTSVKWRKKRFAYWVMTGTGGGHQNSNWSVHHSGVDFCCSAVGFCSLDLSSFCFILALWLLCAFNLWLRSDAGSKIPASSCNLIISLSRGGERGSARGDCRLVAGAPFKATTRLSDIRRRITRIHNQADWFKTFKYFSSWAAILFSPQFPATTQSLVDNSEQACSSVPTVLLAKLRIEMAPQRTEPLTLGL